MSLSTLQRFKLGNFIEKTIAILTLGYGHSIAEYVARKLGYNSCGCETRKQWLNSLFNKNEIKL
jgi:hypothetical protein